MRHISFSTVLSGNIWLGLELELEPEQKLWTKVEPEPKINNFGSATLAYSPNFNPKNVTEKATVSPNLKFGVTNEKVTVAYSPNFNPKNGKDRQHLYQT